jgi:hypothetical protein
MNGVVGVKMNDAPLVRHEPGVVGVRLGSGEVFAGGEENVTAIAAFAKTPTALPTGLIEAMVIEDAVAGTMLEEVLAPRCCLPDPDGAALWLLCVMRTPTIPPITSARRIKPPTNSRDRRLRAR